MRQVSDRNRLALFALVLVAPLLGCQDEPFVTVSVSAIPKGTASLRVLADLDGQSQTEVDSYELGAQLGKQELTLGLRIAMPKERASAQLHLGIGAFESDGCLIAVGSQQDPLTVAHHSGQLSWLNIAMIPVAPSCENLSPDHALLRVDPPLLSTLGTDIDGQTKSIRVYGWRLSPKTELLMDGLPVPDLEWRSPVEMNASVPIRPGSFGPAELELRSPDGTRQRYPSLFSYFSATLEFENLTEYPGSINNDPNGHVVQIVTADVNNDSLPDVISPLNTQINVLLNKREGGFQPPLASLITDLAKIDQIIVLDIDGDQKSDIIAATSAGVLISSGNGDGSFQIARTAIRMDSLLALAVADLDGDGRADIITSSSLQDGIELFINAGAGNFPPAKHHHIDTSSRPEQIALADFDADGGLDLLLRQRYVGLAVWLRQKDGGYHQTAEFFNASSILGSAPIIADFDNDTHTDILISVEDRGTLEISQDWIRGKGDGTFFPPEAVELAGNLTWDLVDTRDLDGDGWIDLLTDSSGAMACVFRNLKGKAFSSPTCFGAREGAIDLVGRLAMADMNGDGQLDLVGTIQSSVVVMAGDGHGGFRGPPWLPYVALTTGDLNQDGMTDIIALSANGPPYEISVKFGTQGGIPQPGPSFSFDAHPSGAAIADFNGDRHPDLAVVDNAQIVILGMPEAGQTALKVLGRVPVHDTARKISVGDIDSDGKQDLVTANIGSVSVFLGNGDGTFRQGFDLLSFPSAGLGMELGDFNGDGKLDMVTIGGSKEAPSVQVFLGLGNGDFSATPVNTGGVIAGSLVTGDVDADGRLDLVLSNQDTLQIMLGTGHGTFVQADERAGTFFAASLGDLDGDHRSELIIGDLNGVSIWKYSTVGKLEQLFQFTGCPRTPAVVGDFNGDRKPDLLLADCDQTGTHIVLNSSR